MLFVYFLTACFPACYILHFGFLTRACVMWVYVGAGACLFWSGGGRYLPTYHDIFFTAASNQRDQRSPKTLKVLDRLRVNRGGWGSVIRSGCDAGAVH